MKLLLELGANIDEQSEISGCSALCIACGEDSLEAVQLLLDENADLTLTQQVFYHLSLSLLSLCSFSVCFIFLSHYSYFYLFSNHLHCYLSSHFVYTPPPHTLQDGNTPLHIAASVGNEKVLELLLEKGIDLHALNEREETAFEVAAMHNQLECVKRLLRRGANLDYPNVAVHVYTHRYPHI